MKTKILQFTTLVLVLAGSFSSCENDIDMSNIDFSNIENLYEQPLPMIQKCVQGEWKLQYTTGGFYYRKTIDTLGSYMHLTKNHITMGNNTGITTDSPIKWVNEENSSVGGKRAHLLTFNHFIYISEQDGVIYEKRLMYNSLIPYQIKNDTLAMWEGCCDSYMWYYTKY